MWSIIVALSIYTGVFFYRRNQSRQNLLPSQVAFRFTILAMVVAVFAIIFAAHLVTPLLPTKAERQTFELLPLGTMDVAPGTVVAQVGSATRGTKFIVKYQNRAGSVVYETIANSALVTLSEGVYTQGGGTLTRYYTVPDTASFWAGWAIIQADDGKLNGVEIYVSADAFENKVSVQ